MSCRRQKSSAENWWGSSARSSRKNWRASQELRSLELASSKHGHPCHSLSHQEHSLDGLLKELVEKPEKVKQHREDFLSRWEARAKVLTKDEEDLKPGMSTHRRRILGPKKLKV